MTAQPKQGKLELNFPLSKIYPLASLAPLERKINWRRIKASRRRVIDYRKKK